MGVWGFTPGYVSLLGFGVYISTQKNALENALHFWVTGKHVPQSGLCFWVMGKMHPKMDCVFM
jgi:hypothetical protein